MTYGWPGPCPCSADASVAWRAVPSGNAAGNFASRGGVVPFASAALGLVQYTGDDSDRALLLPMMRVGFRSMIGDARSLNVSFGFQHESNPKSDHETSADVFDIGVGMSLFRAPR